MFYISHSVNFNTNCGKIPDLDYMDKPKVTIVILVKDNADILEDLLSAIFAQTVDFPFEVLAVDSGSLDGSLAILKRFLYKIKMQKSKLKIEVRGSGRGLYRNDDKSGDSGRSASWRVARMTKARSLRIHQIAPIEFGFGKTRNLAARLAKGEIIVFLSTRVSPMDRDWLTNLIESLSPFTRIASGTVAAFGKVNPGPKISFSEAFRLKTFYGRASRILTLGGNEATHPVCQARFQLLFSDLNGAILRYVLRKYPFPEDIIGGEDQVLARTILENNMSIAYNPRAGVVYLRGHSFGEIFRHYFNKGYFLTKVVSISSLTVFWSWVRFLLHEIIYLIKKQNIRAIFKEIFFELGRLLGYLLGQRADQLPMGLRERFLIGRLDNNQITR